MNDFGELIKRFGNWPQYLCISWLDTRKTFAKKSYNKYDTLSWKNTSKYVKIFYFPKRVYDVKVKIMIPNLSNISDVNNNISNKVVKINLKLF